MTPTALLAELQRRGVTLVAEADALRYRPRTALPSELISELRRHKAVLLRLLPNCATLYAELTATIGTVEDAAAIEWFVMLNGDAIVGEIAALEHRCEQLVRAGADETSYRGGVMMLVARMNQIRAWYRAAQGGGDRSDVLPSRRLTLDVNRPVRGPIRLDDGTEIVDVGKFIAQTFAAIDYVLQQPPRSHPDGTALMRVYIGQLEQVGVVARVESVS